MAFIEKSGVKIYYEEHGNGSPLLCIAGLAATHDAWALMLPALSGKFKTVVFDNRGIGLTKAPPAPFDITRMAEDTATLIDGLGLESVTVAGHSMGCAIAQILALRYPEKVDRLILFNPFARMRPRAEAVFRANLRLLKAGVPAARLFPVIMPWLFSDAYLADSDRVKSMIDINAALPPAQTPGDFERQINAVSAFDSRNLLDRINVSALLVAGKEDVLTPPEDAAAMAERMPAAERVFVQSAHLSIIETPEDCVRLCETYFT